MYKTAKMLMGMPILPRENLPWGKGFLQIFLQSTHAILMEYENPPEPASKPTMELKAVVEPRLMSASTTVIDKEKRIALSGIGVPMVTIFEHQYIRLVVAISALLTCLNHPEKGIPLSRAKEKI